MIYPGLQKILNMISSDPSSLIISRYISLVKDLSDEKDKIVAIQELSKIMLDIDPQETLKYALCVFENNQSLDSLKIIYQAIVALGKMDKASVIKKEIERLEKIQLEEHKTIADSNSATVKLTNNSLTPSIHDIFEDDRDTSISSSSNALVRDTTTNDDPTVLLDPNGSSSLISSNTQEFSSEVSKTLYKETIDTDLDSKTDDLHDKKTTILPPVPTEDDKSTKVLPPPMPVSSTRETSIIKNSSSTNVDSNSEAKNEFIDNTTDVLTELFDFYWKNELYNEAKNLLDNSRSAHSTSGWWLARWSVISKKMEELNSIKNSSSMINKEYDIGNDNNAKNMDEDTIFWNNIDNIMKEKNYRKALANIRSELFISLDKSSNWAEALYQRLGTILDHLGYVNIEWNNSLDKKILYNKVISYIPQKLSETLIF